MKVKHQNEIILFFLLITFMYQVPEFFVNIARNPVGKLILLLLVVYSYKIFGLYNGILVTLIVILIMEQSSVIEGMTDEREEDELQDNVDENLDEETEENLQTNNVGDDLLDVDEELNRKPGTENDEDEIVQLLNNSEEGVVDTATEPVGEENKNIENFSNYN